MSAVRAPSVVAMVEDQVRRSPHATAIEAPARAMTYDQVWQAATQIAEWLPDDQPRVAIAASRGVWGPVAHLAVLLAGASAVPVTTTPSPRARRSLAQAGVQTLLVDAGHDGASWYAARSLAGPDFPAVVDIAASASEGQRYGAGTPRRRADEAYVMYTSGSSGEPKGARIGHDALAHVVVKVLAVLDADVGARFSNNFDMSFDPSLLDIYTAFCSGGTLVVPTRGEAFMPVAYAHRRALTHWNSVPSLLRRAAAMNTLESGAIPTLRSTLLGGEALTWPVYDSWHSAAPRSAIRNIYGPTELAIACTISGDLPQEDLSAFREMPSVPIGSVFAGLEWALVDVPSGSVSWDEGELAVRGPQRMIGYVSPEHLRDRFVSITAGRVALASPEEEPDGALWYRTGDLMRLVAGELVFAGRSDRQVKVRGVRIELAEVEAALVSHPGVSEGVAVVVDEDEPTLVAAYVSTNVDEEVALAHLRAILPPGMWPSKVVRMSSIPVTDRGKVDYRGVRAAAASSSRAIHRGAQSSTS